MRRKTDGLVFRFAIIMLMFAIITLILSGLATYFSQTKIYKKQCGKEIQKLALYLADAMALQGQEFIDYQNYYMEHFTEVNIPYDFSEYQTARAEWERIFSLENPGKTYGRDITFQELSPEAKKAWFIKTHEYWLLTFEEARISFNIPYTYYIVPKSSLHNIFYLIDCERTLKEFEGNSYLYLGDEVFNDPDLYKIEWKSWETGLAQNDFQIWNNDWGHTYAYYYPLIINGQKMGLVGTEMDVESVNQGIIQNTFIQIFSIAAILILCVIVTLLYIRRHYIRKIIYLEKRVQDYSLTKDYKIASIIEQKIQGKNEIVTLAKQISVMMIEMENYMQKLSSAEWELNFVHENAKDFGEILALDALTGIRNKVAFDKQVLYLEEKVKKGLEKFGFVMIDFNNLKAINDTYGYERGNLSLKKLCEIICDVFSHSPVFRINGDEFSVILLNQDLENIEKLNDKFNEKLIQSSVNYEPWEDVSAALGWAIYDKEKDFSVKDVFERSEKKMYERKKEMKSIRR